MKTNVQTTSLEAFYGISGRLNKKEKDLLEILEQIQPASDRGMAIRLDWEIGSVNGRRNSLVEKGIIEEAFRAISNVTKRRVIYWRLKPSYAQESLL